LGQVIQDCAPNLGGIKWANSGGRIFKGGKANFSPREFPISTGCRELFRGTNIRGLNRGGFSKGRGVPYKAVILEIPLRGNSGVGETFLGVHGYWQKEETKKLFWGFIRRGRWRGGYNLREGKFFSRIWGFPQRSSVKVFKRASKLFL